MGQVAHPSDQESRHRTDRINVDRYDFQVRSRSLPDPRGEEELHGRPEKGSRSSRIHLNNVAVVVALAVFAYSRIHLSNVAVVVALAVFAYSPHSLNHDGLWISRIPSKPDHS